MSKRKTTPKVVDDSFVVDDDKATTNITLSRERNRIHAKTSRLRKKMYLDGLKADICLLRQELTALSDLYKMHFKLDYPVEQLPVLDINNLSEDMYADDESGQEPAHIQPRTTRSFSGKSKRSGNSDCSDSYIHDNDLVLEDDVDINDAEQFAAVHRQRNRLHARKSRLRKKMVIQHSVEVCLVLRRNISNIRHVLEVALGLTNPMYAAIKPHKCTIDPKDMENISLTDLAASFDARRSTAIDVEISDSELKSKVEKANQIMKNKPISKQFSASVIKQLIDYYEVVLGPDGVPVPLDEDADAPALIEVGQGESIGIEPVSSSTSAAAATTESVSGAGISTRSDLKRQKYGTYEQSATRRSRPSTRTKSSLNGSTSSNSKRSKSTFAQSQSVFQVPINAAQILGSLRSAYDGGVDQYSGEDVSAPAGDHQMTTPENAIGVMELKREDDGSGNSPPLLDGGARIAANSAQLMSSMMQQQPSHFNPVLLWYTSPSSDPSAVPSGLPGSTPSYLTALSVARVGENFSTFTTNLVDPNSSDPTERAYPYANLPGAAGYVFAPHSSSWMPIQPYQYQPYAAPNHVNQPQPSTLILHQPSFLQPSDGGVSQAPSTHILMQPNQTMQAITPVLAYVALPPGLSLPNQPSGYHPLQVPSFDPHPAAAPNVISNPVFAAQPMTDRQAVGDTPTPPLISATNNQERNSDTDQSSPDEAFHQKSSPDSEVSTDSFSSPSGMVSSSNSGTDDHESKSSTNNKGSNTIAEFAAMSEKRRPSHDSRESGKSVKSKPEQDAENAVFSRLSKFLQ